MVDFLRGLGALGPGDRYVGGSRRGWAVPPGAGDVEGELDDPYDLSDLLAAGFGYQFGFELDWDQAMMMFHPVGGMDALPRALATALRGRIRYACEVRELRTTSEGVEVVFADPRGRGRLIRADHCICTLPPTILRRLHHDFDDEVTSALAGLRTLPVAKLGLEYAERFWETEEQLYGGITWTDLDIGTIWYPSTGYLSERGVVIGYYNFAGDAESYGSLAPQERVARAVETGRRVHGDAYADVAAAFSVHWDRTPYSEGGWVEWGGPRGAAYDTAAAARRQHLVRGRPPQPGDGLAARRAGVRAVHRERAARAGAGRLRATGFPWSRGCRRRSPRRRGAARRRRP